MKMIKLMSMLSLLLLMACGGESTDKNDASASASPEQAVQAMVDRAEILRQQAAKLGHEWSNHAPVIAAAGEALAANDLTEAKAQAELAVRMGEQSVAQAEQSKKDWKTFLPQ